MTSNSFCQVAVPCPLPQLFTYLNDPSNPAQAGDWVRVPFGKRTLMGLVFNISLEPPEGISVRPLAAVGDARLRIPPGLLELMQWLVRYYHAAPGEVVATFVPSLVESGRYPEGERHWHAVAECADTLPKQAKRQQQLLAQITAAGAMTSAQIRAAGFSPAIFRQLAATGAIESSEALPEPLATAPPLPLFNPTPDQRQVIDTLVGARSGTYLLEGVTGSGKSLVYQYLVRDRTNAGFQVLVLVPEIGLIPQMQLHIERLGLPVVCYHSGMSDGERAASWIAASEARAQVVIATRSGALLPLPKLGLIIVDEEHDSSYKANDGIRYQARDLAVYRANRAGVPVLLGSATPSLETRANLEEGRFRHLTLDERVGGGSLPEWQFVDAREAGSDELRHPLVRTALSRHLGAGKQVMVFLNRRGFAPLLECRSCGWQACCDHCDVRFTFHRSVHQLRCHQCDRVASPPSRCPVCASANIDFRGRGTERLEQRLMEMFPDVPVIRVDRDAARGKRGVERKLAEIKSSAAAILVGTQMLAKGHHFPDLTLVLILDIDQALMSPDFRAREQAMQLFIQVAGRAGRESHSAEILVPTLYPAQPLLKYLQANDYPGFARFELDHRRQLKLPPTCHQAILRVECVDADAGWNLLEDLVREVPSNPGCWAIGPHPCLLERRNGRYRHQLQIFAASRAVLHSRLANLADFMQARASAKRCRWHLDIDPVSIDG